MSIIDFNGPMTREPRHGQKVGRLWFANSKEACAGVQVWYGDATQREALKAGVIYESQEMAMRAARLARVKRAQREKLAKEQGMTLPEHEYWKGATEDGDFVFWAEVEAAYRRANSEAMYSASPGAVAAAWTGLGNAIAIAIERYHGRKERIGPLQLKQFVDDIQELSQ